MEGKKRGTVARLLDFAGDRAGLTYVGCVLSAVAMAVNMVPYVCVWLVIRDLVSVAPDWGKATRIAGYGWAAFGFAVAGIVVYFLALMCTHLAAFRTATNIRKRCMAHLAKAPLGYFDTHASGLLRRRIDGAAAQTETLLAHNLADITGTAAMFVTMLALLLVFDWRMGLACLMAAVVSIGALFAMMGGKNANLMSQYYDALDNASKAGTEYVRGIPVVKVFQQTVYSFRAFKEAIDAYSERASHYQGTVCKNPQAVNLTFTEGAFALLVPVALLIAPTSLAEGDFAGAVRVGGVDVRDIDPHVLMDRVAFVFQNTRLFSMSILENVRAARPDATREQVLEALHDAQCDDIVDKLPDGVDTIIGSADTYLSGGEQQRVALARAILKDAPIVVLDEATAFADPENEVLIQRAFARLLQGRTVIMVAHRLSTVVNADRIVVLDRGRVVEQGSHGELVLRGGLYARMWADYQTAAQWKIKKEVA